VVGDDDAALAGGGGCVDVVFDVEAWGVLVSGEEEDGLR
jgi:hypothetical protein